METNNKLTSVPWSTQVKIGTRKITEEMNMADVIDTTSPTEC